MKDCVDVLENTLVCCDSIAAKISYFYFFELEFIIAGSGFCEAVCENGMLQRKPGSHIVFKPQDAAVLQQLLQCSFFFPFRESDNIKTIFQSSRFVTWRMK